LNFFEIAQGNLTFREEGKEPVIVRSHEDLDWCLAQAKANGLPTMHSSSINWPEEEGVTNILTIVLCQRLW